METGFPIILPNALLALPPNRGAARDAPWALLMNRPVGGEHKLVVPRMSMPPHPPRRQVSAPTRAGGRVQPSVRRECCLTVMRRHDCDDLWKLRRENYSTRSRSGAPVHRHPPNIVCVYGRPIFHVRSARATGDLKCNLLPIPRRGALRGSCHRWRLRRNQNRGSSRLSPLVGECQYAMRYHCGAETVVDIDH